jgi:hypothetical protein
MGVWKPVAEILRRGADLSAYSQAQLDHAWRSSAAIESSTFFRAPRNAIVNWLIKG